MSSSSYKTCAVPMCQSTTIKYPEKLFIHVPKYPMKRRKQWLQLARRELDITSNKSTIYFCEDHFDLSNDMENYVQYSVMGSVGKIRMKPDCLPSKFQCQSDRIKRSASPQPRSAVSKRRRMDHVQEVLPGETETPATSSTTSNSDLLSINDKNDCVNFQDKATQVCPQATNKCIQTDISTTAASPVELARNTSIMKNILFSEHLVESSSNSSTSSNDSQLNLNNDFSSIQSLFTMASTSSNQSELSEIKRKIETDHLCRISIENTVRIIKKNPRNYTGISTDCNFIIDLIKTHTKLSEEHILLCLKKIRLNTPFFELGDQFGMSLSHASKIFMKSVPLIASVLHQFIIKSHKRTVKQNLPMPFRHKYHNINCIIDCLDIKVQKPSKSVEQASTWSEYNKTNTVKYLVSSTPDGIINYISPGYSGSTTDVSLVQNCCFLDCLEPGMSILAVRGFKHLDELLLNKGINLVRPPSVESKLSKKDVINIKQIATLSIHIERVIRHLQEFSMFKPHSVVNKKLLKYLDQCVVIACALFNLQDGMIQNT